VTFTGFVPDSDLRVLYSSAAAYVCPSVYEGFGFTVLEAMSCGTPVLCSREASLPEVAGDAALYFDARSPEEIADALVRIVADSKLRSKLIVSGYTNAKRFSWDEAARQTLKSYDLGLLQLQ
jgi:glycosyltransferase involved in cell wall biosynthesis